MSDEQINIAIAEACGWKHQKDWIDSEDWWVCPQGNVWTRPDIPDYCNDLNAMHQAEKVLDYEQCEAFSNTVADIVHAANREKDYAFPWCFARIHATARQRAEAFLRTLGKWEETK